MIKVHLPKNDYMVDINTQQMNSSGPNKLLCNNTLVS